MCHSVARTEPSGLGALGDPVDHKGVDPRRRHGEVSEEARENSEGEDSEEEESEEEEGGSQLKVVRQGRGGLGVCGCIRAWRRAMTWREGSTGPRIRRS